MDRLSDVEWARVRHLFPQTGVKKATGRPGADSRAVLDAILWIERTGERWLYLPTYFPRQQTCYARYLTWKRDGTLAEALAVLAATHTDEAVAQAADGRATV